MEQVTDGLNGPSAEFRKVGAWPASVGMGGASGVFNTEVYNPGHYTNQVASAPQAARRGLNSTALNPKATV